MAVGTRNENGRGGLVVHRRGSRSMRRWPKSCNRSSRQPVTAPRRRSCSSGGTTTARACWTRTSSQSSCAQVSDSPRWRCPTHTSQRWWRRSTTTGAGRSASPSWQTSSSAARPRSSLALRLKACSHRISAARGQSSPSEHGRSKGLAAERRRRSTRRWPRSCNRSSRRPATGPRRRSCSRDGTSMGRACWTRTSSGNSCGPASS
mmetsp:Transcript_98102/g.280769  ORF Transcript_98102/g.280769 Transcript_98102/m.280769 type:complete len:205 (-) Transcript_98102:606-1220(-)